MFKRYGIIQESARRVAEAANGTLDALRDGRIEQEPAFTERMLARIEHEMEGLQVKSLAWKAKTLSDRGAHSQEKQYGADFMGVFHADLPDYNVAKGFLAQAKRIEPGARMDTRSCLEMQTQCEKMLSLSPCASFLFLYSTVGITVVPARSVVHANGRFNPHQLYGRSITSFFEDHFECFIGDEALDQAQITAIKKIETRNKVLIELQARFEAERILYLGLASNKLQTELEI